MSTVNFQKCICMYLLKLIAFCIHIVTFWRSTIRHIDRTLNSPLIKCYSLYCEIYMFAYVANFTEIIVYTYKNTLSNELHIKGTVTCECGWYKYRTIYLYLHIKHVDCTTYPNLPLIYNNKRQPIADNLALVNFTYIFCFFLIDLPRIIHLFSKHKNSPTLVRQKYDWKERIVHAAVTGSGVNSKNRVALEQGWQYVQDSVDTYVFKLQFV